MNYLKHLTRNKHHSDTRWFVKTNSKGLVREIKMVYEPNEYTGRKLLNQEELIQVLKDDRERRTA